MLEGWLRQLSLRDRLTDHKRDNQCASPRRGKQSTTHSIFLLQNKSCPSMWMCGLEEVKRSSPFPVVFSLVLSFDGDCSMEMM